MSIETKPIRYPRRMGDEVVSYFRDTLHSYIRKFKVVGSLGRDEMEIGDVDILVEPKGIHLIPDIRNVVKESGEWKRGGDRQMSIANACKSPLHLDLFLCHPPAQWGILVAVRLNPIPLVLWGKDQLDQMGYIRENGTLHDEEGIVVPVSTEKHWFDLLGLSYPPPHKRWELVDHLGIRGYGQ